MNFKIYRLTILIALIISGITLFFDHTISIGIICASLISILNLLLLSYNMKMVLNDNPLGASSMFLFTIIRFTILGLFIFISIKNPHIINIIGVTIGLTLFLFALVIDSLKRKGES